MIPSATRVRTVMCDFVDVTPRIAPIAPITPLPPRSTGCGGLSLFVVNLGSSQYRHAAYPRSPAPTRHGVTEQHAPVRRSLWCEAQSAKRKLRANGNDCHTVIEDPSEPPMPHTGTGWLLPELRFASLSGLMWTPAIGVSKVRAGVGGLSGSIKGRTDPDPKPPGGGRKGSGWRGAEVRRLRVRLASSLDKVRVSRALGI
jgi:hypothetical protein